MVSQVLGPCSVFYGSITIPDAQTARQPDADRLNVIRGAIDAGHAAIYWTDGSYISHGRTGGFSGAGVVWNVGGIMGSKRYKLQRYMGKSEDAELFAIAAALGCSRSEVRSGRDIRLVRVYADSMSVLKSIKDGTVCCLEPMLSRKTALEDVYERADFLKDHGVTLEPIWVKGHSGSEGNHLADRAADRAVRERIALLDPDNPEENAFTKSVATETDVPDIWRERGEDWVQEWLFRANTPGHTAEMRKALKEVRSVESDEQRRAITGQQHDDPPVVSMALPVLQVFGEDPINHQGVFLVPDPGSYDNVPLEQSIAHLRSQSALVEFQILDSERLLALGTNDNANPSLRHGLSKLYVRRSKLANKLNAQLEVQSLELAEGEKKKIENAKEIEHSVTRHGTTETRLEAGQRNDPGKSGDKVDEVNLVQKHASKMLLNMTLTLLMISEPPQDQAYTMFHRTRTNLLMKSQGV